MELIVCDHVTQLSPAPAQRYNQRQRISSGVRPLAGEEAGGSGPLSMVMADDEDSDFVANAADESNVAEMVERRERMG